MRTVLSILSSLDYGGAARQLTLLAGALPRDRYRLAVIALGGEAPWADDLRNSGIEVHLLGWRRPFDLLPILKLRQLIQSNRPDVVHLWGMVALRAFSVAAPRGKSRLIVSDVLSATQMLRWSDRWLLRRASVVTAWHPSEAESLTRQGVPSPKITLVPLAVSAACFAEEVAATSPLIPPQARVLLGIGPLEAHKGFRDAIWALDILHYLYDDLCLVLIGAGSERKSLAAFSIALESRNRVHFIGRVVDVTPWLRRASVVWSTTRFGGAGSLLEAAAAARPVVAYRVPGATDVIADGTTGYLVDPGDKPVLARQTRLLLDDEKLRHQFGLAAQEKAASQTPRRLAEAFAKLYDGT